MSKNGLACFAATLFASFAAAAVDGNTDYRVAIIGAGAAGSSAAFWTSLAAERLGRNITVDVFERSNYIGGRKSVFFF